MRNFKKVLSLVLCLAMMLSIMVVGAGAAFNDQSKIVNTEAVDMCSALNIINGYTDGSFKPEGTITRAEACKMICVALNGGKEPVLGTNATASFTDIKGHWAEGYIEYCVSEGIVAGIGGGKFNPNGNVTGSQFAKMLLIALGYRADHEQFVGNAWEVNVNVKASQKALYEDLASMDPSVALTRDNAAQMVWNALQAKEVTYDYTLVSENGQLVSKVTVKDVTNPKDLMTDKYGAETSDAAMLTRVTKDENKGTYNLFFNNSNTAAYTKVANDYSDLIGQNVKVVNKASDKVLGVFADDDSAVIAEGIVGQLALNSAAGDSKIKLNGVSYDLDQAANATPCYLTNGNAASDKLSSQIINSQAAWGVKLIDNDGDGDVNLAVLTKVDVAKVTYVNSKSVRVGATEYKYEDHNIYDGAKKDDYAVIVDAAYTVDNKAVLTKADTVTGKISSVKTNGNGNTTEARIDGTWYKSAITSDTTAINNKVELIVYEGVYFAKESANTDLKVATITAVGSYDGLTKTIPAKMYIDGKEQQVNISKYDTTSAIGTTAVSSTTSIATNIVVEYNVDGDEYEIKTIANNATLATDYTAKVMATKNQLKYVKKSSAIVFDVDNTEAVNTGNQTWDISKDATIIVNNTTDDKYTVLTGSELTAKNDITFTAEKGYVVLDDDEVVYMYVETGTAVTSGDTLYGYVTGVSIALNASDKTKLYLEVITADGQKKEYETNQTSVGNFTPGSLISYVMDGDVMEVSLESGTAKAIKDFDSNRVLFRDGTRVSMQDDTVIIAIDSSDRDDVVYAGDSLVAANADSWDGNGVANGWLNNAMYLTDSDGLTVIIVQVASDVEFS